MATTSTVGGIAVGYDTSAAARDALALGELLARTAGGELLVVRVHAGSGDEERRLIDELEAELEVVLNASTIRPQARVLADRSPSRALLELAASEPSIGVIALGSTHRAGLGRVMPGSVAERLLSGAPCSVAVAPRGYAEGSSDTAAQPLAEHLRVIAVAFDASKEAAAALRLAVTIATAAEATLRVIAVGSPSTAVGAPGTGSAPVGQSALIDLQRSLHEVVAKLPTELRALPIYEQGVPAARLLDRAHEGVDLLMMGSRGHGPLWSVVLGATSTAVIAAAPCPVLITPRPAIADAP